MTSARVNAREVALPLAVGTLARLACNGRTPLLVGLDSVLYYLFALDWQRNFEWRALLPFRTPAYPMLLGEALRILGESPLAVTAAQTGLGLITIFLVSDMARRVAGSRVGLAAGLICALYPTLIFFENFLLTETLATCLITAFYWFVLRYEATRRPLWLRLAGLSGALAALTRPTLLPLLAVLPVLASFRSIRARLPELVRRLPLHFAYAALLLLPWVTYVALRGGTASLTVATGWQLWIYQHIEGTFDDSVPSFAPYRERYRAHVALDAGQASGWWLRADIEQELDQNMPAIDRLFLRFGLENIARHPARYAGKVLYSAAYFSGLIPVDDQEKNEADFLLRQTLRDRAFRLRVGERAMQEVGYTLPPDPRARLVNPFDGWLAALYDALRQRGFLLTPLFVLGAWALLRREESRFFGGALLAGVLLVMLLHNLFLANPDRYHRVVEPVMLVGACALIRQPQKGGAR